MTETTLDNIKLPQELILFLNNLSEKLSLDNASKSLLFNEFMDFANHVHNTIDETLIQENNHELLDGKEEEDKNKEHIEQSQEDNGEDTEVQELKERLLSHWGDKLKCNKMCAKRALKWLEVDSPWDLHAMDMFKLMNKLVDLGKLLIEDNNLISNLEDNEISKESAVLMRKKLMTDKNFFKIITDKNHSDYKQTKNKLDTLNKIIVSNAL